MSESRLIEHMQPLFELLKGGLWCDYTPNAELFNDSTNWEELFAEAKRQTIAAVVWDGVEKLPAECRPPRSVVMRWYGYVNRVAQSNMLINTRIKELFTLFEASEIHPVLMKGASIGQLYPNPLRRGCGDIDLYFGERDIEAADRLLCERYGEESCTEKLKSEESMHSHFKIGGISVENHRFMSKFNSSKEQQRFEAGIAEWYPNSPKRIEIEGVEISVLPDGFNTQFLYIHLTRHFIEGGVGLRQLCDLAILMSHYRVCEGDIIVRRGSWKIIERLLVRHLGLSPQQALYNDTRLDKRVDRVLEFVLREGNFGFGRELWRDRPTGYIASRLYNLRVFISRNIDLISLFPHEIISESLNRIPNSLCRAIRERLHIDKELR